jgi:hypothetical protein
VVRGSLLIPISGGKIVNTDAATLSAFLEGPGKDLLSQARAAESDKVTARRRELAARLQELEKESSQALPPALRAQEQAAGAVKKAEVELKAARQALQEASGKLSNLRTRFGRERDQVEAELRATAPGVVAELRQWITGELEATRKTPPQADQKKVFNAAAGLSEYRTLAHNRASILRRLEYLQDARDRLLPELALLADPKELSRRCQAIRDQAPEIKMEPFHGGG